MVLNVHRKKYLFEDNSAFSSFNQPRTDPWLIATLKKEKKKKKKLAGRE